MLLFNFYSNLIIVFVYLGSFVSPNPCLLALGLNLGRYGLMVVFIFRHTAHSISVITVGP